MARFEKFWLILPRLLGVTIAKFRVLGSFAIDTSFAVTFLEADFTAVWILIESLVSNLMESRFVCDFAPVLPVVCTGEL